MHIRHTGFTFIEVLVALAVLALIATFSVVGFQNYYKHAALTVATQEVYGMLRDARGQTLGSENALVYGVHLSSTTVTRFAGDTYDPMATSNESYSFEYGVIATGTIAASGSDVIFSRLSGTPNIAGSILLVNADGSATKTVVIHASGLIEY